MLPNVRLLPADDTPIEWLDLLLRKCGFDHADAGDECRNYRA
jgi:hypothetical protein